MLTFTSARDSKDFTVVTPQLLVEGILQTAVLNVKEWQQRAQDGGSVFGYDRELGSIWQNPVTCGACHVTMNSIAWLLSRQIVLNSLENIITYGCGFFLNKTVCSGAVHEMGNVLVPQMTEFLLTGNYSCSRTFGFCSAPTWTTLNPEDYIRRLMLDKPKIIKNNDFVDNLYKQIKEDKKQRETVRILHMSDLHIDLLYKPGTNKHCNMPL